MNDFCFVENSSSMKSTLQTPREPVKLFIQCMV